MLINCRNHRQFQVGGRGASALPKSLRKLENGLDCSIFPLLKNIFQAWGMPLDTPKVALHLRCSYEMSTFSQNAPLKSNANRASGLKLIIVIMKLHDSNMRSFYPLWSMQLPENDDAWNVTYQSMNTQDTIVLQKLCSAADVQPLTVLEYRTAK